MAAKSKSIAPKGRSYKKRADEAVTAHIYPWPRMPRFDSARFKQHLDRLQESLPAALARRFVEIDLLTHAASLSFYALISLAPLLVLVLWLTASLYPSAQDALIEQVGGVAGAGAEIIAGTVIENATERPDVGSLAGLWSTLLLFV